MPKMIAKPEFLELLKQNPEILWRLFVNANSYKTNLSQ